MMNNLIDCDLCNTCFHNIKNNTNGTCIGCHRCIAVIEYDFDCPSLRYRKIEK